MKKIFILIFLIIFANNIFALSNSLISFASKGDDITITLNKTPESYDTVYYKNGVNFFLKGVTVNNLIIKKFDNSRVVRVLPLSDQLLIKIQYPLKDLRQHVQIIDSNNSFSIIIKKTLPVAKVQHKPVKTTVGDKSVVDVAKELSLLKTNEPAVKNNNVNQAKNEILPEKNNSKNIDNKKDIKEDNSFKFDMNKGEYDFSKNAFKTYMVLFILCIFIVALALFFRKFKGKLTLTTSGNIMKIIYRQQIMPKKSIIVAKIFDDYYILGVTDSHFTVIDKIVHDSVKDEIRLMETKREKDKFLNYLEKEEKIEKKKEEKINDKEKLIKLIQNKLKNYNNNLT